MRWIVVASIALVTARFLTPVVCGAEPTKSIVDSAVSPEVRVADATPVNHHPAAALPQVQYVVECKVVEQNGTDDERVLSAPKLSLPEGKEGTIKMHTTQPFVTGVRRNEDGIPQSVITSLNEGTAVSLLVTSLDNDQVQLDATFTETTIDDVQVVPGVDGNPSTQVPTATSHAYRVVRSTGLGDSVEISCGRKCCCDKNRRTVATLNVTRVDQNEPAITPIRTTEAERAESGQLVWNSYNVVDLLEPHAQIKALDQLSDTDFVPVVDMVISEATAEWPDDAQIRADTKNGHLVINQTQTAHEKIGQLLRDKRDNIAAVKRLMR